MACYEIAVQDRFLWNKIDMHDKETHNKPISHIKKEVSSNVLLKPVIFLPLDALDNIFYLSLVLYQKRFFLYFLEDMKIYEFNYTT